MCFRLERVGERGVYGQQELERLLDHSCSDTEHAAQDILHATQHVRRTTSEVGQITTAEYVCTMFSYCPRGTEGTGSCRRAACEKFQGKGCTSTVCAVTFTLYNDIQPYAVSVTHAGRLFMDVHNCIDDPKRASVWRWWPATGGIAIGI